MIPKELHEKLTYEEMWLLFTEFGYPDRETRNMFRPMTVKQYKQLKKEILEK